MGVLSCSVLTVLDLNEVAVVYVMDVLLTGEDRSQAYQPNGLADGFPTWHVNLNVFRLYYSFSLRQEYAKIFGSVFLWKVDLLMACGATEVLPVVSPNCPLPLQSIHPLYY